MSIWICFTCFAGCGQKMSGQQLLDKAIGYHDPSGVWPRCNGALKVLMVMPDGQAGEREMQINVQQE